jgi:hypothetical protein
VCINIGINQERLKGIAPKVARLWQVIALSMLIFEE